MHQLILVIITKCLDTSYLLNYIVSESHVTESISFEMYFTSVTMITIT